MIERKKEELTSSQINAIARARIKDSLKSYQIPGKSYESFNPESEIAGLNAYEAQVTPEEWRAVKVGRILGDLERGLERTR